MTSSFDDIESQVSALEKEWQAEHEFPAGTKLYHFTSAEGLRGIHRDASIWATLATNLGDEYELRHIANSLPGVGDEQYRWRQPWDRVLSAGHLRDPILQAVEAWQAVKGPFVSSFCRCNPTEFGSCEFMWENYAEDGAGFALGIRFTPGKIPAGVEGALLRKVLYGETQWGNPLARVTKGNKQIEVFRKRVERARVIDARGLPDGFLNPGMEGRRCQETAEIDWYQARLYRLQMELAASAKHIDFSQEQETRLLVYQVEQALLRKDKDGRDVSYIKVPVGNLRSPASRPVLRQVGLELVEIVAGPKADLGLLGGLLRGQSHLGLDLSGVPIRHCQVQA